LQNLFSKYISSKLLPALLLCGQVFSVQAQESKKGIIESLQELVKINQAKVQKLETQIKGQTEVISSLNELQEVKINPITMRNILFYSDSKFTSLIDQDECRFLMLLETGLLKESSQQLNTLVVDYLDDKKQPKSAIVTLKDFLEFKYKKSCTTNRDIKELYNATSWKKTYDSMPFVAPKNIETCKSTLNKSISNPHFPYILSIGKVLNDFETGSKSSQSQLNRSSDIASLYKTVTDSLDFFNLNYLRNLYKNFDDVNEFCKPYIAEDAWTKSLNGELPLYVLKRRCELIANRSDWDTSLLTKCSQSLNKKPELCSKGDSKGQSLFPSNSCNTISDALQSSRLFNDYFDCPSNVDNLSLINSARVINHLNKIPFKNSGMCSSLTFLNLYELFDKAKQSDLWRFKICYNDRADNSKICLPYIPGTLPDSQLEEGKVLALAMSKVNGTPESAHCKIVDKTKYNPSLLEYSVGCFVVTDINLCTPNNCDREIFFDKKPVTNVTYEGDLSFDYFPNDFINEQYSLVSMITESMKKKGKVIRSLTDLENYFKDFNDAIIHGVGCGEDLYPEFFKKTMLNQCMPIPFIIDGIKMHQGQKKIIFHASIDQLQSPRMLAWNLVFNAVSNFKLIHPLNTWTMYGIK